MRVVLRRLSIAVIIVLATVVGFTAFAPYVAVEAYSWPFHPTVFGMGFPR